MKIIKILLLWGTTISNMLFLSVSTVITPLMGVWFLVNMAFTYLCYKCLTPKEFMKYSGLNKLQVEA